MASIDIFTGSAMSDRADQIDGFLIESLPGARLLVPTRDHARQRMHNMIRRELATGFLGRPVLTFQDFVEHLLHGTAHEQDRVDESAQRLLLERIVADMARDGELDALGDAAATPGFVAHLHRTIAQLKQSAVEPEQFLGITRNAGRNSAIDRLVGRAYAAYQEALKSAGAYDVQGMYWIADHACRDSLPATIGNLKVLILDGFDDFTESEFRLVRTLAEHLDRIVFGLVVDLDQSPEDQGRLVRQTYSLIEHAFDFAMPREANGREPKTQVEFASLHLFSREQLYPDSGLKQNIRTIECYNPRHEAETIADEIKRAVREGRAWPDRIAVVHADAGNAAGRFRTVFQHYGIPCNVRGGVPLDGCGLGAFLQGLFRAIDSWSRHDVLQAVASSYSGADPANAFDAITRAAGITQGRHQWQPFIERFAAASRRSDPEFAAPLSHVPNLDDQCAALLDAVRRLERTADAFPAPCRADALADWIIESLEGLGVPEAIDAFEADARERALEEWAAVDAALRGLKRWYGPSLVDREEAARIVRQCLSGTELRFERERAGVWFGSPADIRHLSFDLVFCAGMSEGVFPSKPTGNAIYGEHERAELAGLGIRLRDADWYAHRQTGLFQRIFDCATDELVLSWPVTGDGGEPLQPSPFIEDLEALFDEIERDRLGTPSHAILPDPERCGSPRDVRNRILESNAAYDGDGVRALEAARIGAEIEKQRYESKDFDEYDGVLSDMDAVARIAERFGPDHRFSASELNVYLQCPFRFFLDRVLRVKTIEEPDDTFDPLLRGLILHRALETFYTNRRGLPLDAPDEAAIAELERAIEDAFERWSWAAVHIPPALVDVERLRLFHQLERFVRWSAEHKSCDGWTPEYLEAQFGRGRESGDGVSTPEPFTLDTRAGPVLIQGKIDRIDTNGEQVRVIDYKSGSLPSRGDIKEGADVQLTLYALAAMEHLLPEGRVQSAFYWTPGKTAQSSGRLDALNGRDWTPDEAVAVAKESVATAVLGMREGRFPLKNTDQRCKGCPDGKVCRFEEGRVNRKTP